MTLRRNLLGLAAGAVAAKAALPIAAARAQPSTGTEGMVMVTIPSPDSDLLAACAAFLRMQRAFDAHCTAIPGDVEEDDPGLAILDGLEALVDRIATTRATTAEGFTARLRCQAFHSLPSNRACQDDPKGGPEDRFAAANLRDAVRLERGVDVHRPSNAPSADPSARPQHLDADLLTLVDRLASTDQQVNTAIVRFGEDLDRLDLPAHEDQRRWQAFLASTDPSDKHVDIMLHEIAATPAYTADGRAAKARVVQRWIGDGWDTMRVPRQDPWERVAWSLAEDALRARGAT